MTEEDKVIADCDAETIESLRAQVAELKAENERLTIINSRLCYKSKSYVIHNARLEEERDELKRQRDEYKADAARYRWIRDTELMDDVREILEYQSGEAADLSIDFAMKGETE